MAVGGGGDEMEKDFEARLRLQRQSPSPSQKVQRNNSITFRAPQEQFTINDFELGKIYGVGSYSKVWAFLGFVVILFVGSLVSRISLYVASYVRPNLWHLA